MQTVFPCANVGYASMSKRGKLADKGKSTHIAPHVESCSQVSTTKVTGSLLKSRVQTEEWPMESIYSIKRLVEQSALVIFTML